MSSTAPGHWGGCSWQRTCAFDIALTPESWIFKRRSRWCTRACVISGAVQTLCEWPHCFRTTSFAFTSSQLWKGTCWRGRAACRGPSEPPLGLWPCRSLPALTASAYSGLAGSCRVVGAMGLFTVINSTLFKVPVDTRWSHKTFSCRKQVCTKYLNRENPTDSIWASIWQQWQGKVSLYHSETLTTFARVPDGVWELAQAVAMCSVDLEKAVDWVPWGVLWGVLWDWGKDSSRLLAIQSLEEFLLRVGLSYGCCISLVLFIIFMDVASWRWDNSQTSVKQLGWESAPLSLTPCFSAGKGGSAHS